jgi:hypothetical protein
MSVNGIDAFSIFNSVRLHYNQEKYDYFKYGQTKISFEAFDVRPDKYSFVKLGRLFNETDLPYFLSVNFYENPKGWVRDFFDESYKIRFLNWIQQQTNRESNFIKELDGIKDMRKLVVCKDNQFPILLTKIFQLEVSRESLVILDHFLHLTIGWNKQLKEDFIWQEFYKKYTKYKPFFYNYTYFDTTLYKNILKNSIG